MILLQIHGRTALAVRLAGLALISWSVIVARYAPGLSGRGLVISIAFAAAVVSWLYWTASPGSAESDHRLTPDAYVLAAAGGVLVGASPTSAASAFTFVAIVSAAVRVELNRALPVAGVGLLALAVSVLVYDGAAIGLLAYALGFAGAALAASNARQSRLRAAQAELLLAQNQRSHEEQLRAARLEESTRIAREIHDVLAHSLAGLSIQLEATAALIEHGADRDDVLRRVRRAHQLARDGLRETRRAVGALRGERDAGDGFATEIEGLARDQPGDGARLTIDGDRTRLAGDAGRAVLRVVQEALTNVSKHAPGTEALVTIDAGPDEIVAVVANRLAAPVGAGALAGTGGGYGIAGMHERAQALGGTVIAGPSEDGWRVRLTIPTPATAAASTRTAR